MEKPKEDVQIPVAVWQSALLTLGCQLDNGSQIILLKLEPLGDCQRCTPTSNGSMLPFDMPVRVGEAVTISWDSFLSRYIVESRGERKAA